MRAGDFVGAKIYRKPTEDKRIKKDGTPRSPKKLGKIHFPVFTPGGTRVVGFMVRQSDIADLVIGRRFHGGLFCFCRRGRGGALSGNSGALPHRLCCCFLCHFLFVPFSL